jgi:hypothetical protein
LIFGLSVASKGYLQFDRVIFVFTRLGTFRSGTVLLKRIISFHVDVSFIGTLNRYRAPYKELNGTNHFKLAI